MLCVEICYQTATRARALLRPSEPLQCGHAFSGIKQKTQNTKLMSKLLWRCSPRRCQMLEQCCVELANRQPSISAVLSHTQTRPPALTHAHPSSSGFAARILALRVRCREPHRATAPAAPVARHFLPGKGSRVYVLTQTRRKKKYVLTSTVNMSKSSRMSCNVLKKFQCNANHKTSMLPMH